MTLCDTSVCNYPLRLSSVGTATSKFLSRQDFCRDKSFVATNTCLKGERKKYFCRDKHTFVATKDVFCRDKHVFVATKMILIAAPANEMIQPFPTLPY